MRYESRSVLALRESNREVCMTYGVSGLAVSRLVQSTCDNVSVICSRHERLSTSFSSVHDYGVRVRETLAVGG